MSELTPVIIRRSYPRELAVDDRKLTLEVMKAAHADEIQSFGKSLSDEDLTFLRLDITQTSVVAEWVRNLELGHVLSLLVREGRNLIGYVSLWHNEYLWTSHLAEVRVLVSDKFRNTGLPPALVMEAVELADEMNLERVVCQIAAEQAQSRQMLENIGFSTDALLQDWLRSADGRHHDLLIMSRPVEETLG